MWGMLNWEKLIYYKIKRLLCHTWIARIYSDRAQMWVTDMTQMNFSLNSIKRNFYTIYTVRLLYVRFTTTHQIQFLTNKTNNPGYTSDQITWLWQCTLLKHHCVRSSRPWYSLELWHFPGQKFTNLKNAGINTTKRPYTMFRIMN